MALDHARTLYNALSGLDAPFCTEIRAAASELAAHIREHYRQLNLRINSRPGWSDGLEWPPWMPSWERRVPDG